MRPGHARSIRDIAHLYISTQREDGRAIVVAGVDAGVFPGFHVAGLAAAFAVLGRRVRVVERSGLLVNAGRFLALPPQVYAARERSSPSIAALEGIDVWYAPAPRAKGPTVDLVHVPPLVDGAGSARPCDDLSGASTVVIASAAGAIPDAVVDAHAGMRCILVGPSAGNVPRVDVLGHIDRWRRSLTDILPAPVRDRGSRLSRAYLDCARRLSGPRAERRAPDGSRFAGNDRRASAR